MSQLSTPLDTYTVVAPALVSQFEAKHYWHGISEDPPELLYRSDLDSNPFPHPKPGDRFFQLPVKTARGTWGTALKGAWHEVAPLIVALFKRRHISYSVLTTTRFSIEYEDGHTALGPVVIWVALHPNRNTASDARDVSPDVLQILVEHGVEGAVVEWYEGTVERLAGPPLLRATNDTNPSCYVRRALTAALGMPIAAKEMEADDTQGSVSFFFHENRDKDGAPSNRVFGVSNKHVLCKQTTVDYELKGAGAPRQHIRACGDGRYEETCVALQTFVTTTDGDFCEIARRGIGWVDWAPKIAIGVGSNPYTLDIGTFELDPSKFSANFKGNVVDLGNKFDLYDLNNMFWPNDSNPTGTKFPSNRQLQIRGVVSRELLANPDCFDDNGNGMYVVAKDGNATDLTVGRYAGLGAYLCDESGNESIEVAVYNYSKASGNFSAKGDSGSLIFTGDGRKLAVLHSGMLRGLSSHVTFGTPAWWVVDRLMLKYKYADFNREAF